MKVLHIITGISREGGGPSRSSQGLVAAQCQAGIDAYIWSFDGREPWFPGVRSIKCDINNQALLTKTIKQYDLIHIHGIWSPKLHKVAAACRNVDVPYIIAPRGMLEPWSLNQKWLKKRIVRWLYQDRDLKHAAALHATAASEEAQFRALGFNQTVIISPNGVNLPTAPSCAAGPQNSPHRALFVSRMHKKKGVLELVEAWSRVKPKDWVCELVYTMNSDEERSYEQQVKSRVHELGLNSQFIFTGALDDDAKWSAYYRANLFILPTYSENFGIVVAEALWAGVPVITTKGTPWKDLVCYNCGWWIDLPAADEVEVKGRGRQWKSLQSAIREATGGEEPPFSSSNSHSNSNNHSTSLQQMGANGRFLIESKYTWPAVTNAMILGYKDVLSAHDSTRRITITCMK